MGILVKRNFEPLSTLEEPSRPMYATIATTSTKYATSIRLPLYFLLTAH